MYCDSKNQNTSVTLKTLSCHTTQYWAFYTPPFIYKTICKDFIHSHFPTSQVRESACSVVFSASHTEKSGLPPLWVAVLGNPCPRLLHVLVLLKQKASGLSFLTSKFPYYTQRQANFRELPPSFWSRSAHITRNCFPFLPPSYYRHHYIDFPQLTYRRAPFSRIYCRLINILSICN